MTLDHKQTHTHTIITNQIQVYAPLYIYRIHKYAFAKENFFLHRPIILINLIAGISIIL